MDQKNARFMRNKEHDIDLKEYQIIGKEVGDLEEVVGGFELNLRGSEYWKAITRYNVEDGVGEGSGGWGGYIGDDSVMVRLGDSFGIELKNQEMEFERNVVSNWKNPGLAVTENPSALPPSTPKNLISAIPNFPNS